VSRLQTGRLTLRPFTLDDFEWHGRLYDDPEVTRWLGDGPWLGPLARERSERAVRCFIAHWDDHGFGVWAVEERRSGRFIGQCGLNTLDRTLGTAEVEILWALEQPAWGFGYATEAARAALAYAFDVVRLDRIVALARPQNGPSRRIMDKLGMRWEREIDLLGGPAVYYAVSAPPARTQGGSS
jgi:ribosomal-protein-alanine N-acetyltransferase